MAKIFPSFAVEKETPNVALISVCTSPQVTRQIADAADPMPWRLSFEHFEKYFGAHARTHWSASTKAAKACIAVVDLDHDPAAALETIEFLHQCLPGKVSIIALSSDQDPSMVLKAMRAGASEYLLKPLESANFHEALTRLERRFQSIQDSTLTRGSVICFLGAKGGVGTTTLAIHLAIHLVTNHKKKTLLIDNDPGLGHVCLYLGLEGVHHSFGDLLRSVDRLDTELLQGYVAKHSSGLDVIASAEMHGAPGESDPEALRRTLEFVREEYDFVLLDCSTSLDEATMTVVERATQVYLIANPEIGAVRDLSRLVDGLIRYQQPPERLRVVMNRSGSKGAISKVQIEKAVRLPIALDIPDSYVELARAANMGRPVPPEDKSEFTSQLRTWSREITVDTSPEAPPPVQKRSTFWKRT